MEKFLVATTKPDFMGSIPTTGQFEIIGTPLSRSRSPNAWTIVAALPSAGNIRPSSMRRSLTPSDLKPEMILRGGHSRTACATNAAAGPTSARNWSAEMSFVKLQRPLAVISTFDPSRALRSMTTQEILRSAATAAANMPAAPPPIIASLTGVCLTAVFMLQMHAFHGKDSGEVGAGDCVEERVVPGAAGNVRHAAEHGAEVAQRIRRQLGVAGAREL